MIRPMDHSSTPSAPRGGGEFRGLMLLRSYLHETLLHGVFIVRHSARVAGGFRRCATSNYSPVVELIAEQNPRHGRLATASLQPIFTEIQW